MDALFCVLGLTLWLGCRAQPEQVHIALGERLDEMTVMWSTFRQTDVSMVQYGLSQDALDSSANGTWQMLNNRGTYQYVHRVKLTDLLVDTQYYKQNIYGRAAIPNPLVTYVNDKRLLQWCHTHKIRPIDKWKKVTWFDESSFTFSPTT
ncbi:unnamed protein product [Larinioides sclopetarius]|uniref:Purple acid phosphatase N-terminal domain-containing protein n=1 Tax=Larinioides sclopetarius TaxID=280406 RepID=A0AAV2A2Y7_9ARAC